MNAAHMDRAIELAKIAAESGEVPVGAVVVKNGKIIGEGYNLCEAQKSALAHAEMIAISNAMLHLSNWRLDGCELYVTLEPCPMCAGAIINSRIKEVVFGAFDKNKGSCSGDSVINLFSYGYDFHPAVYGGIRENECAEILTNFFKKLR